MAKTAYIFLVDGFEEIEAIFPADMLRRAGVNVFTVSIKNELVKGAHGITVKADITDENFTLPQDANLLMLPGGLGTETLLASKVVEKALIQANKSNILIAAICAAPKVLYKYGLLSKKTATVFPTLKSELVGINLSGNAVEQDGNIITARSAGVSLQFSGQLIKALLGEDVYNNIINSIYP